MDSSDIFKLIEKIFPVLIFLVWLFITAIANAKKKGPAGKPMPPSERTSYERSQEQSQKRTGEGTQISDDLKRTLETIFGEKETTQEQTPQPEPVPETMQRESEPIEQPSTRESSVLEEQNALKQAFDDMQKRAEQISVSSAMKPIEEESEQSGITISKEELKKGIIWSEILSPPVSMRY